MQIAITRFPGFCKMVERAIAIAESAAEEFPDKKVYTLGRLAHNDRVSERLSKKGISVALSPEELTAGDVLVISAHGAPPSVYAASAKRGIIVRDATCPNIVKIHDTIKKYGEKGYFVLLIGDEKHREIVGDSGWARDVAVADNAEKAISILAENSVEKAVVVFQTTFEVEKYSDIADKLQKFAEN